MSIGMEAGAPRTWDAFEAQVSRAIPHAHRLAAAIVGPDDATDVIQDALVEAWRHLGSLRDPDRFDAWFLAIVANRSRNVLRTRARRPVTRTIDVDAHVVREDHGPDTETVELRDALDRAFEHLSAEHRTVLALRYTLDMPLGAIAATLGIPEGTVKSRIHAALERLRAAYMEDGR